MDRRACDRTCESPCGTSKPEGRVASLAKHDRGALQEGGAAFAEGWSSVLNGVNPYLLYLLINGGRMSETEAVNNTRAAGRGLVRHSAAFQLRFLKIVFRGFVVWSSAPIAAGGGTCLSFCVLGSF